MCSIFINPFANNSSIARMNRGPVIPCSFFASLCVKGSSLQLMQALSCFFPLLKVRNCRFKRNSVNICGATPFKLRKALLLIISRVSHVPGATFVDFFDKLAPCTDLKDLGPGAEVVQAPPLQLSRDATDPKK